MAKVFINSKDTVSVRDIDELESHVGGTFHGILIPAGRTETTVTAERNEFKFTTFRAAVHGTTKRRVTAINHLLDVFNHSVARMKSIYHFFIMIGKDSLKDIHEISMKEMKEKENPNPLMNEGKGS